MQTAVLFLALACLKMPARMAALAVSAREILMAATKQIAAPEFLSPVPAALVRTPPAPVPAIVALVFAPPALASEQFLTAVALSMPSAHLAPGAAAAHRALAVAPSVPVALPPPIAVHSAAVVLVAFAQQTELYAPVPRASAAPGPVCTEAAALHSAIPAWDLRTAAMISLAA